MNDIKELDLVEQSERLYSSQVHQARLSKNQRRGALSVSLFLLGTLGTIPRQISSFRDFRLYSSQVHQALLKPLLTWRASLSLYSSQVHQAHVIPVLSHLLSPRLYSSQVHQALRMTLRRKAPQSVSIPLRYIRHDPNSDLDYNPCKRLYSSQVHQARISYTRRRRLRKGLYSSQVHQAQEQNAVFDLVGIVSIPLRYIRHTSWRDT